MRKLWKTSTIDKGFTLMELLGVIIILSILVILVFPKIVNSVKNNTSDSDTTEKIIYSAANLYISDNSDYYKKKENKTYCISLKKLVENKTLKKPIKYKDKEDITNYMTVKITYKDGFNYELVNTEDCIEYPNGEIVYFDVDTGKSCDTYTETQSNTGVKSGCMKFYAFNDNGKDTLNLILDHNTTATVAWNSSRSNQEGPKEVIEQLKSDTDAWVGTITPENYTMDQTSQKSGASYTVDYSEYKARLITANEIAEITGNTGFDEVTASNWYYLDSLTQTQKDTCKSGDTSGCSYGWLYDRTHISCTKYGCLNNSNVYTMGYWTVSSDASASYYAWDVLCIGYAYHEFVYVDDSYGVRPVITILKSQI